MNYNNPHPKTTAPALLVVCAVVFSLFTFFWLYQFQADTLAVVQHTLSKGQTHYNPLMGALIITVILFIVQQGVYAILRTKRITHGLTYFPSFLLLAVLSSLGVSSSGHVSMGVGLWLFPVLLVLWGGLVWLCIQLHKREENTRADGFFSRPTWINLLMLSVMMLMVTLIGNTNAVYHYRTHAEVALRDGHVDEALRVGARSHETDESLTMLRLYALSQQGLIGDSLFSYAIAGTSSDMLPQLNGSRSHLLIYPVDSLWAHFGALRPSDEMTVHDYLDALALDTLSTPAYRDYRLAGMLIDRQLDSFVVALPNYYPVEADSLPRHYREALTLYYNIVADSTLRESYSDTLMLQRWLEFQDLREQYPEPRELQLRLPKHLTHTYWPYYLYK